VAQTLREPAAHNLSDGDNLGGATAAALAITGLSRTNGRTLALPDDIMWQLKLDYTSDLAEIDTPLEVARLISDFAEAKGIPISAKCVDLPGTADALFDAIKATDALWLVLASRS